MPTINITAAPMKSEITARIFLYLFSFLLFSCSTQQNDTYKLLGIFGHFTQEEVEEECCLVDSATLFIGLAAIAFTIPTFL